MRAAAPHPAILPPFSQSLFIFRVGFFCIIIIYMLTLQQASMHSLDGMPFPLYSKNARDQFMAE